MVKIDEQHNLWASQKEEEKLRRLQERQEETENAIDNLQSLDFKIHLGNIRYQKHLETKNARIKEDLEKIKDKPLIKNELLEKKEYNNLACLIKNDQKARKEWLKKQKQDKAI